MSEQAQPSFAIQRVYLKGTSLEQPNSPQIFLDQDAPQISLDLDVAHSTLHTDIYEVSLTMTVTTKIKDKTAFLLELTQAGIFQISNIPEAEMPMILGIACPNIVYPYLRSNVADLVQRSGFPPVHLTEINFEAYYHERLAAAAQKNGAAGEKDSGLILPPGATLQ